MLKNQMDPYSSDYASSNFIPMMLPLPEAINTLSDHLIACNEPIVMDHEFCDPL